MSNVLQSVVTTYLGPTNTKPAHIVARTCSGLTHTQPLDHGLTIEQAHRKVAMALIGKLGCVPEPTLKDRSLAEGVFPWTPMGLAISPGATGQRRQQESATAAV